MKKIDNPPPPAITMSTATHSQKRLYSKTQNNACPPLTPLIPGLPTNIWSIKTTTSAKTINFTRSARSARSTSSTMSIRFTRHLVDKAHRIFMSARSSSSAKSTRPISSTRYTVFTSTTTNKICRPLPTQDQYYKK